jgi:hypothetical protein
VQYDGIAHIGAQPWLARTILLDAVSGTVGAGGRR